MLAGIFDGPGSRRDSRQLVGNDAGGALNDTASPNAAGAEPGEAFHDKQYYKRLSILVVLTSGCQRITLRARKWLSRPHALPPTYSRPVEVSWSGIACFRVMPSVSLKSLTDNLPASKTTNSVWRYRLPTPGMDQAIST
jgi:hypothetical protein